MRELKIIFIASMLLSWLGCVANNDTMNGIFHPNFHTLEVKVEGNDYAPPVISLNSDDHINISFDEIADDTRYLRYSLIHCDSQWQPSGLVDPEFVDGFNLGNIDQYEFSQLTTAHYVHYSLSIPNNEVQFTISGNYLVKIFDESDPDTPLLQARFMVCENTMKATADVTSRTDIDFNGSKQQLSIEVNTMNENVHNLYQDLNVVITQNSRLDNAVSIIAPMRTSGNKAYYEHQHSLIFDAGNEYRRIETVSTTYPGMGVESIDYAHPYYHMTLGVDRSRYNSNYSYDQTQHGRFTIREYNSSASEIEADYVVVHFSLDSPELINTDIFLDGDFTHRRFNPESRMIYNRATGCYEKSLLLKQGAYNYQYLVLPLGTEKGLTSIIEGNFYQTINEYLIAIYHRQPGSRYDRLVAVTTIFSGR